jgi:hypothetical protein
MKKILLTVPSGYYDAVRDDYGPRSSQEIKKVVKHCCGVEQQWMDHKTNHRPAQVHFANAWHADPTPLHQ